MIIGSVMTIRKRIRKNKMYVLLNSGAMKIVLIGSGNVATHLGKALT